MPSSFHLPIQLVVAVVTVVLAARWLVGSSESRVVWRRWLLLLALALPVHIAAVNLLPSLAGGRWPAVRLGGYTVPIFSGLHLGLVVGCLQGGIGRLVWNWRGGSLVGSLAGSLLAGLVLFYASAMIPWSAESAPPEWVFWSAFYTLWSLGGGVGAMLGGSLAVRNTNPQSVAA